jgi:hypothetical protein
MYGCFVDAMFEAILRVCVMQVNCTSDGVGSGGKVPHCRACS